MALHAVCFLLLLSMLPLLDATDCVRARLYCPAGLDCNSDNVGCVAGADNCTVAKGRIPECDKDITAFFSRDIFEVRENNGPVEPVIRLSRSLDCCSTSLMIKITDVTTTGRVDYDFPRDGYVQAIVPGGLNTGSFAITIKDDKIIEGDEYFNVTIVKESLPHGYTWQGPETVPVYILDDDRGCVSLSGRTTSYSVRESQNSLAIPLELTTAAAFDIDVFIEPTRYTARECDFEVAVHKATFKAGSTRTTLRLNIIDDDIYEGPELFNFAILPATSNNAVTRCSTRFRGSVTIVDDEPIINVKFEASSYRIEEDVGTLSPRLILDRPSPCCITVLAELVNGTALGGGIDYGNKSNPSGQMKYVFPAGETCAEPDRPILIIQDRMSERDEYFSIRIIPFSAPLGIRPSTQAPRITLKDVDIEVCFEDKTFRIDEDKELRLRLKLDKPAEGNYELQVYAIDGTAESGVNYVAGPYNATFRWRQRISSEFAITIITDPTYTGDKYFSLMINDSRLPVPLVACEDNTENVTICDNEYTVCFNQPDISVVEGDTVGLALSPSKRLSRSVRVNYIYTNGTGYPAIPSTKHGAVVDYYVLASSTLTTTTPVRITTRGDNTLEFNETFAISIPSELIHNTPAAEDCITKVDVLIINDDYCTVNFEKTLYPPLTNKNLLIRPVIKLSNPIGFPIQVLQSVQDGTAKSGEDYEVQEKYPIIIYPEDKEKGSLNIKAVDDDVVEIIKEEFYIDITDVTLASGGVVHGISIGERSRTTVEIKDDDASQVVLLTEGIKFSKPIFSNVSIEIDQVTGPTFFDWVNARNDTYTFDPVVIGEIVKIRVCIPKDLYDERPRRVTSNNNKVVICSYVD